MLFLIENKIVKKAFIGQQALNKRQITFIVLNAKFPLAMFVTEVKKVTAYFVFFQQDLNDIHHGLVLENPAIDPQGGAP
ncbi:hypothetical protein Xbed_01162 [Xenorhabdus beddingii]|uniref:Uncharacterized protein n=1 Tax=Xenorhabdus beddingii TaxID=40578 RepID=A0A1Y2SP07_9GAMM|nr:hypothetical protein Xbed_01162 [Xenorhabdus beddingii]